MTLVLIGRWWGSTDSALSAISASNQRIESKVDQLIEHDRDQEVRLRVIEEREHR